MDDMTTTPADIGPRAQLSRQLDAALSEKARSEKGFNQAKLAKLAEISKGSVSHALNPEAGLPTEYTLVALAGPLGITGGDLEQLLDWRYEASRRKGQLDDYLRAAGHAILERRPYGLLPGGQVDVANVYTPQHAHRRPTPHAFPEGHLPERQPALDVLAQTDLCFMLAGPGGGKSSLLRAHLNRSIQPWQRRPREPRRKNAFLPVLVPAVALMKLPFPEAVAAAATAQLHAYGLAETLTADFFRARPADGACWQFLIDGLNEIADPQDRVTLLGKLAAIKAHYGTVCRLVVATRPLPNEELDTLGAGIARYVLEPFPAGTLATVAGKWFRALDVPDADHAAAAFTDAVDRAHLTSLSRIPLMAALLCALYARDPAKPLPASRGMIYRRFVEELSQHQHEAGPQGYGFRAQTSAIMEQWGKNAADQAEYMLDRQLDLIIALAAERYSGNTRPTADIVASLPAAKIPRPVPQSRWTSFLLEFLPHSGLLEQSAGEYVFIHHTIVEYLAALHTARDASKARTALRNGFIRSTEGDSESFTGFLIDSGHPHSASTVRFLEDLLSHEGLQGCLFIAAQAQLGTSLPDHIIESAKDALNTFAREMATEGQPPAVSMRVIDIGPDSGPAIAKGDPFIPLAIEIGTLSGTDYRVSAAMALAALEDPRATDILSVLAEDPSLEYFDLLRTATALARCRMTAGSDILHNLACDTRLTLEGDPGIHGGIRAMAAKELARLGDPRAREVLELLINDRTLPGSYRARMAEALASLDESTGIEALHTLASDTEFGAYRLLAAEIQVHLGDYRGLSVLASLAEDQRVYAHLRIEAAKALRYFDDPRGARILASIFGP